MRASDRNSTSSYFLCYCRPLHALYLRRLLQKASVGEAKGIVERETRGVLSSGSSVVPAVEGVGLP